MITDQFNQGKFLKISKGFQIISFKDDMIYKDLNLDIEKHEKTYQIKFFKSTTSPILILNYLKNVNFNICLCGKIDVEIIEIIYDYDFSNINYILNENSSFSNFIYILNKKNNINRKIKVIQKKNTDYKLYTTNYNGGLFNMDISVVLEGKYAKSNINQIFKGEEKSNNYYNVNIIHDGLNTVSLQKFKALVDKKLNLNIKTNINISKKSNKSDAYQKNQILQLDDNSTIKTDPNLEINNDDVKCTHGSAISNINQDELFYLKTRGLDKAQNLIFEAFLNPKKIKYYDLFKSLNDIL